MKLPFKRLLAALLAALTLLALAGCGSSGKTDAAPKDYTQILHDARPDEDNEYYMIFSPGKEGKFTAQYGYSESYEDADQLDEEIRNMLLPLLNLEEGDYTDFSASVSGMMVQSYALAIVKPAEGRQEAVKQALLDFVTSEQSSMEHYRRGSPTGTYRRRTASQSHRPSEPQWQPTCSKHHGVPCS